MLGSLVMVEDRVGLVARRVGGGWLVLWPDGSRQVISWNQQIKKWTAREKAVNIVSRKGKEN